jgi:hypothetical protein
MFTTKLQTAFLATALSLFVPPVVLRHPTVLAQTNIPVQFQRGRDTATLSGTITGQEYTDYVLRARGGQLMSVALTIDGTNGNGSAFFNILPPGSRGEAIFNGSTSPNRNGEVRLPRDGDYTIRVYLMGNDRDTGKTVGYKVSVKIQSPSNTGASRPSSSERAGQGIYDATGNVPCAQYKGQPMSQCSFGVARDGNGSATVAVTRLDGRKRFIFFTNGKAVGADLSQADGNMTFRATKEGDLYIIQAGNERYEISEAVIFGG